MTDAEVVIVGAGVAGTTLLEALASRGVDALLLERSTDVASTPGASSIPFALLNPHRGRTARVRRSDGDGLAAFWRLCDRLALDPVEDGVHRSGVVRIASSERQAAGWRELLAASPGPRWLEPGEIPRPFRGRYGGFLVPDGGWVEPAKLLATLTRAAVDAGAGQRRGEFIGWRRTGDRLSIETAVGADRAREELLARELVLCLGAYDATKCRLPTLELAPGVSAAFSLPSQEPPSTAPPPLAGAISVVVEGSRALLNGGALPHRDGKVAPGAAEEAAERLRTAACWFMPSLAEGSLDSLWLGVRARRPSGNPIVRRLAPGVTLYGGLAGRGFLCAPLLSERLAAVLSARSR